MTAMIAQSNGNVHQVTREKAVKACELRHDYGKAAGGREEIGELRFCQGKAGRGCGFLHVDKGGRRGIPRWRKDGAGGTTDGDTPAGSTLSAARLKSLPQQP